MCCPTFSIAKYRNLIAGRVSYILCGLSREGSVIFLMASAHKYSFQSLGTQITPSIKKCDLFHFSVNVARSLADLGQGELVCGYKTGFLPCPWKA